MRISDWSSDVCSSDLLSFSLLEGLRTGQFDLVVAMTTERVSDLAVKTWTERLVWIAAPDQKPAADRPLPLICYPERSEERRVGNECVSTCRSRWWQYH